MSDSPAMGAEREVQPRFRFLNVVTAMLLGVSVLLAADRISRVPKRVELGARTVPIRYRPVALDPAGFAPLTFVGAWELSAPDPRFGGISALAVAGGGLLAVSDSGVVMTFPRPGAGEPSVRLDEIGSGPGDPGLKRNRDVESLLRDPSGRGWWVGFENRNRLWLFDHALEHVLAGLKIGRGWPMAGFEAVAERGGKLLLVPESGGRLLAVTPDGTGEAWESIPAGPISDAVAAPDGTLLLIERRSGVGGFDNHLVQLRRDAGRYRRVRSIPLGVSWRDNLEGLAIEPRPRGAIRLWLIADDGLQWPMRTLLVALDWPARRAGGEPR